MDEKYAITQYLGDGDLPPINCIIKRLYSDFIVIEMPEEGRALHPDDIDEEDPEPKEAENEPLLKRPKIFTEKDLDNIDSVSKGVIQTTIIPTKDTTKEDRKEAHAFIRDKYNNSLLSNGKPDQIEIIRFDNPNRNKRDNRHLKESWSQRKGDYVHFTLTKENKDVSYLLSVIRRFCGLNTKVFSTAGSKDRRAITSQRICAYKVPIKRIRKVQDKLQFCWLTNFKYSNERIQLGSLWGNRFSIILRDINIDVQPEDIAKRVKIFETEGFLNYFGHQRFGSLDGNTAEIGKLILSHKWEEAVLMILKPKEDTEGTLKKALKNYLENRDPKAALKEMLGAQRTSTIESTILLSLKNNPMGFRSAILALQRDTRSLYVHAYQSLVFNQILTRRYQKFGLEVLKGDFNAKGEKIECVEGLSLSDVYLPLPSYGDNYPDNEVGKWYGEIEKEDKIPQTSFVGLEKDFSIGNVRRAMIVKPQHVKWELISQPGPRTQLQTSPFVPENHNHGAVVKELSIGNSEGIGSEKANKQQLKNEDEKSIPEENISAFTQKLDEVDTETTSAQEEKFKALKIEFDLPSSAYATIALKQLLRNDFSKSFQKKMEKD